MARRLQKSKNRLLLGVAGGVAEYFNADPVIIRVIFVLLVFANGIGILLYLLLALLMPKAEAAPAQPLAVVKENLKTAPRDATEAGRRIVQVLRGSPAEKQESVEQNSARKNDGE
ncbi:MAG: PspC domain-containing protein [Armatimonadetes bacterium]|nr:PspC domain-containing protein [Armatimonadota bacterium]